MSRSQIDRLTGRIEALQAQRKPPEQRIFTVLVRNHMRTDEEIARFCAEHGVTDSDHAIPDTSAHAAAWLRLCPSQRRPRHTGATGLARPQEHPAYGSIYRAFPRTVPGFLEGLGRGTHWRRLRCRWNGM